MVRSQPVSSAPASPATASATSTPFSIRFNIRIDDPLRTAFPLDPSDPSWKTRDPRLPIPTLVSSCLGFQLPNLMRQPAAAQFGTSLPARNLSTSAELLGPRGSSRSIGPRSPTNFDPFRPPVCISIKPKIPDLARPRPGNPPAWVIRLGDVRAIGPPCSRS